MSEPSRRGGYVLAGALIGLLPALAAAQSYPQLHVVALSQRADRASVPPSGVFQITIHVKIAQRRERLDELILGSFVNCEIISNETVRTALPDGTDFIERLNVQALAPGEATISPAYIDALDPSIGKPMRFSSNAIRVHVSGGAPLDRRLNALGDMLRRVVLAAAIGVGGVAAVFVLGVIFVRRRRARPVPSAQPNPRAAAGAPPPVVAAPQHERLAAAYAAYAGARSEASLAAVRAILFELAGAGHGATLVDALRSLGERDRPVRLALLAAERAMFGPAAERGTAGDEMLAAVQAYLERRPANEDVWTR